MDTRPPADEHEAPPGQRYTLFFAAIAAALLGIATLDLSGTPAPNKPRLASDRSPECIVASAVFVGVQRVLP